MERRPALRLLSGAAAVVAGLTAPTAADDEPPRPAADGPPALTVRVAPVVWLPRLTGDAGFGGTALARNLSFAETLDLRGQEATFTGDLTLDVGDDWRIHLDGFHFSTSGQRLYDAPPAEWGTLSLTSGDAIRTSMQITSLELDVARVVARASHDAPGRGHFRVAPALGVRWVDVEQSVQEIGVGRSQGGGSWVGILAGAEIGFGFRPLPGRGWPFHRMEVRAHAAFGPALGSFGGTMSQIRAGVTFWATERVGVTMGFRLLHVNASRGDYTFEGGLQGMFIGGAVRF